MIKAIIVTIACECARIAYATISRCNDNIHSRDRPACNTSCEYHHYASRKLELQEYCSQSTIDGNSQQLELGESGQSWFHVTSITTGNAFELKVLAHATRRTRPWNILVMVNTYRNSFHWEMWFYYLFHYYKWK